MKRREKLEIDEYYHIYSRGVNKMDIFIDNDDLIRFQKLLYAANSIKPFHFPDLVGDIYDLNREELLTDIGSYAVMPNHFHILVRESIDGGTSRFMRKLLTSYSMYFNLKYERTGTLFESRYKSRHVSQDNYLKYLFAYIPLNPVKIIEPGWKKYGIQKHDKIEKFLKSYSFSSYVDHVGEKRKESKILKIERFPEYFSTPRDYGSFIKEWLNYVEYKDADNSPRSVLEDGPRGRRISPDL